MDRAIEDRIGKYLVETKGDIEQLKPQFESMNEEVKFKVFDAYWLHTMREGEFHKKYPIDVLSGLPIEARELKAPLLEWGVANYEGQGTSAAVKIAGQLSGENKEFYLEGIALAGLRKDTIEFSKYVVGMENGENKRTLATEIMKYLDTKGNEEEKGSWKNYLQSL